MWCYKDGVVVVDTPVVTGNVSKGYDTPSGSVWAIDAKKHDAVLKGEGYTQPVTYWMPFMVMWEFTMRIPGVPNTVVRSTKPAVPTDV